MNIRVGRQSNTTTIASFYENYLLKKFDLNPPYQRQSIWSEEKQSFLIDSIMRNYPIPPIFLHQKIEVSTGKTKYDVIDGKQRITSIIKFIQNEIPIASEIAGESKIDGKYFKDFDDPSLISFKKEFWKYDIPIEYIDNAEKQVVDNIFDRLNRNGEPLTGQELRNAKYHGTPLLNKITKLADDSFWEKLLVGEVARMGNLEFISELMFYVIEKNTINSLPKTIDKLYAKYANANSKIEAAEKQFGVITSFLSKLKIDYDKYKVTGVSHLYSFWCFSQKCVEQNIPPKKVAPKIDSFLKELRSNVISNESVKNYKLAMSSRTKSKSQRDRRWRALCLYCDVS